MSSLYRTFFKYHRIETYTLSQENYKPGLTPSFRTVTQKAIQTTLRIAFYSFYLSSYSTILDYSPIHWQISDSFISCSDIHEPFAMCITECIYTCQSSLLHRTDNKNSLRQRSYILRQRSFKKKLA